MRHAAKTSTCCTSLNELQSVIKGTEREHGWIDIPNPDTSNILCLCKCAATTQPSKFLYDLTIKEDFTWELLIHGCKVKCENLLSSFPDKLTHSNQVLDLVHLLDNATICPGNPDKKFVEMVSSRRKRRVESKSGEVVANVIEGYNVYSDGREFNCTVRTTSCTMLINGTRCSSCRKFRAQLRSMHSRYDKKKKSTR